MKKGRDEDLVVWYAFSEVEHLVLRMTSLAPSS